MTQDIETAARRLLVINPNSNPEVTARVRRAAQPMTGPDTHVITTNPPEGPVAIESAADRQAAIPQVLSLVAGAIGKEPYDGYILACFDDIGTDELRSLTDCPVISLAEAAMRKAERHHRRFAVVTTVASAVADINALLAKYRISGCCGIWPTGIGVTETTAQTPEAEKVLAATLCKLRDDEHAEAIILGSAAYAGRGPDLSRQIGIPIIDGLHAALMAFEKKQQKAIEQLRQR